MNSENRIDACDDLQLLTTTKHSSGRLFDAMGDTSAATAQAARMAAQIQAEYPSLWPETVRGLLVHSARWTKQMCQEFPDGKKSQLHERLRCYGYGVPDIEQALWSAQNQVALIYQGELQPFARVGSEVKTKEWHLHPLPWPKEVLEAYGEVPISLRVTLSYFIEPSPGRKGWSRKHRYASHGLRFSVQGSLETIEDFRRRISKVEWAEEEDRPDTADTLEWLLGSKLRSRGSLHSDVCTGTAAEIASCAHLAVFPVTGWWKERPHLQRDNRKARYSLIVSLETKHEEIDLYTPIRNQIAIVSPVVT